MERLKISQGTVETIDWQTLQELLAVLGKEPGAILSGTLEATRAFPSDIAAWREKYGARVPLEVLEKLIPETPEAAEVIEFLKGLTEESRGDAEVLGAADVGSLGGALSLANVSGEVPREITENLGPGITSLVLGPEITGTLDLTGAASGLRVLSAADSGTSTVHGIAEKPVLMSVGLRAPGELKISGCPRVLMNTITENPGAGLVSRVYSGKPLYIYAEESTGIPGEKIKRAIEKYPDIALHFEGAEATPTLVKSGDARFSSGVTHTSNIEIEVKFKQVSATTGVVFVSGGWSTGSFLLRANSNKTNLTYYTGKNSTANSIGINQDEYNTLVIGPNYYIVNGGSKKTIGTGSEKGSDIVMFGLSGYNVDLNVKYCIIKSGGVVVKYYVPVLDDGTACFLDLVSGNLCKNAVTTGSISYIID